jgi:hypothetical protein
MSKILYTLINEIVLVITELVNYYSGDSLDFNTDETIKEVFQQKIKIFYKIKKLEDCIENKTIELSEYSNIEENLKLQKSTIQEDLSYLKNIDECLMENNCVSCKDKLRCVIFLPCRHLLYCNDCIKNKNLEFSKICSKCEEDVIEIKIVSLN